MQCAASLLKLEDIMLSKVNQKKKDKQNDLTYLCYTEFLHEEM